MGDEGEDIERAHSRVKGRDVPTHHAATTIREVAWCGRHVRTTRVARCGGGGG